MWSSDARTAGAHHRSGGGDGWARPLAIRPKSRTRSESQRSSRRSTTSRLCAVASNPVEPGVLWLPSTNRVPVRVSMRRRRISCAGTWSSPASFQSQCASSGSICTSGVYSNPPSTTVTSAHSPPRVSSPYVMAQESVDLAQAAFAEGRWSDCIDHYTEVIDAGYALTSAWARRGVAKHERGDSHDALGALCP